VNLKKEETNIYRTFRTKIKCFAYFAVILSCFVLLNVFVGFSSAPFYDKDAECFEYALTAECKSLKSKTARLYFSELLYGALMTCQGIISLVLVDNIKKMSLAVLLRRTCKVCLLLYMLLFLMRVGMFFNVHAHLKLVIPDHEDKGFGSFFAEYIDDESGSIVMTLFLLSVFGSFYILNIYIIRQMNKMVEF